MALVGKRLLWYFNIGGETAEVLMPEEVKSNGDFNSIVLERYDTHTIFNINMHIVHDDVILDVHMMK